MLPPVGGDAAQRLAHVLQCERCADAALVILMIPAAKGGKGLDYEDVLSRFQERAAKTLALIEERRAASWRRVGALASLSEEKALEAARALAAEGEPWAVSTALVEVARELARSDPARAAGMARCAAAAAEEIGTSPQSRASLLVQAQCLLGDACRKLGSTPQAEEAFGRAAALLARAAVPGEPRATFCLYLARLRRDQGRMEEAAALLHRARILFEDAGDVVEAEMAQWAERDIDLLGALGGGP